MNGTLCSQQWRRFSTGICETILFLALAALTQPLRAQNIEVLYNFQGGTDGRLGKF